MSANSRQHCNTVSKCAIYELRDSTLPCTKSLFCLEAGMDLGSAKLPRIGINALYDAIDPVYGLVWTDGQMIFIIPYDCISRTFDFASSTKHGNFQRVREVQWFRNSTEGRCFLCIVLDCVVTVWLCEGKSANVHLVHEHRINVKTIAHGCLRNPKVDVLCLLSGTQCIFYTSHLKTTVTPYTLPLDPRMSAICGCWSKDGSLLVIGAGASLLVYRWFDIGDSLQNFRVMNCNISGLAGVRRLSAVECLSEVQFVCATQLPLDQLCIQYNKEIFVLPDDLNQVEESSLSNEPDESVDVVVRPNSKEHSSSHLDKLLHLPRTYQASCSDSSQLVLIEVDTIAEQAKKLSSINIAGLLSPDILHVCIKSDFVIAGSNTSNMLSLFKVSNGHLNLSGSLKLSPDERLKGLCSSLLSKSCEQAGAEAVLMMTGRISASDQIFPPTSSSTEYHLCLHHVTDFRQQFESQNIGAIDPVMSLSSKNVGDYANDEIEILSPASSRCQNTLNHITETKVTADSRSPSSTINDNAEDVASLKLPSVGFNLQKKPFIEVIGDSNERMREEKDKELETECRDFKTVLPVFATDQHPHMTPSFDQHPHMTPSFDQHPHMTPSFGNSIHCSSSRQLDTEINSSKAKLDLPSALNADGQNDKPRNCSAKCQDTTNVFNSLSSEINVGASGESTGTRCKNCLHGPMSDVVLMQLKQINLKLQLQEECLAKIRSSVEAVQQVSRVTKYQPASKPDVIRITLKQTSGIDVQKCFVLDNHRLHLNAVKEAFHLVSVELLVDGDACVLHADVDGFIPLYFSPNESIFISGEPATHASCENEAVTI